MCLFSLVAVITGLTTSPPRYGGRADREQTKGEPGKQFGQEIQPF